MISGGEPDPIWVSYYRLQRMVLNFDDKRYNIAAKSIQTQSEDPA